MIKSVTEMIKELRDEMRGGKGTVEITHILNEDEIKGKCRMFAKVKLNPGCSIGMHKHEQEEEVYYIISGSGIINDNGEIREVKGGDVIITGNGAEHSIENKSENPLEFVAVILVY